VDEQCSGRGWRMAAESTRNSTTIGDKKNGDQPTLIPVED